MKELTWHERGRLWLRLGLRLVIALLVLWALVGLGPRLWSLFAPFLLAIPVALVFAPAVKWLNGKLHLPRPLLTILLLLLSFALLGGLVWGLSSSAVREIVSLAGNWEGLVASFQAASETLGETFSRVSDHLPASAQMTADNLAQRLFTWLETVIPRFLSAAVDYATGMVRSLPSFAVASVVFIMAAYFLTADYPRLRAGLSDRLPRASRPLLAQMKGAASAGFGGYLRAQLILSAGVFVILLFGFLLTHQDYALLLAFGLAVLDFIPILGSGTVLVPWMVADLFTGSFRHALGLAVVWGMVSIFRRVGEPKILGDQTGLPPVLSLVSIYAGMRLAGVLGMVLAPILCLVGLDLYRSGLLDRTLADLRMAGEDISAILAGGRENP